MATEGRRFDADAGSRPLTYTRSNVQPRKGRKAGLTRWTGLRGDAQRRDTAVFTL
jgi:hypothetical protein